MNSKKDYNAQIENIRVLTMSFLGPFAELNTPYRQLFINFNNLEVFFYDDAFEKQTLDAREFAVYDHQQQIKTYLWIQGGVIASLGMQANGILMPKARVFAADGSFQLDKNITIARELKIRVEAALKDKDIPEINHSSFSMIPPANCEHLSERILQDIHQRISEDLSQLMAKPRLKVFQYFILRAILTGEMNLLETAPLKDAISIRGICHELRFRYLDPSNTENLQTTFPGIHPDFIQTAIQSILLQMMENLDCGIVNFHDFNPRKHIPNEIWAKLRFFLNYENLKQVKICFDQILTQGLYQSQGANPLNLMEKICNFFIHLSRMITYYFGRGHHAHVMNQVKTYDEVHQSILRQSLFQQRNEACDLKQIAAYVQFR